MKWVAVEGDGCVRDDRKEIPRLRRPTFAARMKEEVGVLRSE